MNSKKCSTNSGLPLKRSRRAGVWVAIPTGQVSRWQTRIMMQPDTTSGRRSEAELLGTEQGGDHDVATGLELAVDLHDDPVAQPVSHECLLRLREPELPRDPGVLYRGERCCACPAVVAGDEHHVGLGLSDACGDGADADLGHELHVHPRQRVGGLQVVDQLRDVLDRVDVVVRRRRDEADSGGR